MPPAATVPVPGRRTACLLLALVYLNAASPAAAQSPTLAAPAGREPITPIPAVPAQDPRRLALGERLFSDRRLSHDNTRACSTCHVYVTKGAELLSEQEEEEEDILDKSFDVRHNSRLGCQSTIQKEGEIEVEITRESLEAFENEHPEHRGKYTKRPAPNADPR